jgi:hypothetical protein
LDPGGPRVGSPQSRITQRQGQAWPSGWPARWPLSELIDSLLFGITSRDPLTFVLMPAAIALVTILANVLPVGGALRENPVVALRN